jgi:very-short-patch-repair endonuclease
MTDVEHRLWYHLRQRQMNGCKFRRQYPIGPFVTDFVCLEAGLVIEVDGGQHSECEAQDDARTRYLEQRGFRVLRFWNDVVLRETESVLQVILEALRPHPDPPPQAGEGTELQESSQHAGEGTELQESSQHAGEGIDES